MGAAILVVDVVCVAEQLVDTHVSSEWVFLLIVVAILLFIGLFLESLSMLLIMVPVLLPTVLSLGIDVIWFGIFFVILIEIALITPPVGLNLFVIQAVARSQLSVVVRGVTPLVGLMLLSVFIIWLFPTIVTFLPNL